MPHNLNRSRTPFDPHGYQPLIVDEDCLADMDRREALVDAFDHPRNWTSYLTREERQELARALEEMEQNKSPYFYSNGPGESTAQTEKRAAFARLGMYRAFARAKFADGHRIWYGDRPPWQQNSG